MQLSLILQCSTNSVLSFSFPSTTLASTIRTPFNFSCPFGPLFCSILCAFTRISFVWSWSDHVTCLFKIRLHPWFHLGFCAVHLSSSDTKQIKLLVSLQTCPLNFSPCVLTCADVQTVEVYLLSSASSITSFIKTLLISIPTNFWSLQFSHHPHAILCLGYTTFPALCDYNFC